MPINLTDAERNAPAGMSTIDGGVATGRNPILDNVPAPVAAPAPAPAQSSPAQSVVTGEPVAEPAPTNMETLQGIKTEALRIQDILNQRQADEAGSGFNAPGVEEGTTTDPFDVEAEQRRSQRAQLKLHQAEIDATNQVYDQLLNEARVQGQGRIGSTRAIGARGGLLGSDFAGAQKAGQQAANKQERDGIQAERQAKIGNIMGKVRSSALADVEQRRLAYSTNAEAVLADIKGQKERRQNNINAFAESLLAQGIDIEDLSPEELNAFATESGITEDELRNGYAVYKAQADAQGAAAGLETRKTEAEIRKIEADIESGKVIKLSEGNMLYDTTTGETFKNPKTFAPKGGGTGGSTFSSTDEQTLLGGGWSEGDMASIDADVRANGLPAVIENAKATGATDQQIRALEKTYGAEEGPGEQFLSQDYFSKLFTTSQLEEAAAEAGFGDMGEGVFNLKDVNTGEYLKYLDGVINSYREAGFSDQEILKQMQ